MSHKFSTKFVHQIKASEITVGDKLQISEASAKALSQFVPWVDFHKNSDLIGIACDTTVVNRFNSNGDAIDSKTAIAMLGSFSHKPMNLEHDRSVVVGHTMDSWFSETSFHKALCRSDVENKQIPFFITIGAVIYRVVNKGFAELLDKIKDGEEDEIFASWEIAFSEYHAAVGNSDLLSEREIVTDPKKVEELSKYMKGYGGKGVTPEGVKVGRLITGEAICIGIGLTHTPAAQVGGIYIFDKDSYGSKIEKNSQLVKADVNVHTRGKTMTPEELKKIVQEALASNNAPNATEKIADAILNSNKSFVADKEAAEAKLKRVEDAAAADKQKLADLEKKMNETQAKLDEINQQQASASAKQKFDERMTEIDSAFVLVDADRKVIGQQVQAIASNEAYVEYRKSLDSLLSEKSKEATKKREDAIAAEVATKTKEALAKAGVTDPLDTKKVGDTNITNGSQTGSQAAGGKSLAEQFSAAFSKDKIKISV